ncbi:MAG: phospholipase [Acidobacteriota bacterium]
MSDLETGTAAVRRIATIVHGTYLLEVPPGVEPPALVMGFHGYGEGAEQHLEALRSLVATRPEAPPWALCSVQALHPFYTKSGRVVASWMTKFDRDRAIGDNVHYISAVLGEVLRDLPSVRRLAFTGFSQGVAMAYRAAAGCGRRSHALVVLGGDVPPEVQQRDLAGFPPVLVGAGKEDRAYLPERMEQDLAVLRNLGVEAEGFPFDGGHEWTDSFRRRAGEFLAEHLS